MVGMSFPVEGEKEACSMSVSSISGVEYDGNEGGGVALCVLPAAHTLANTFRTDVFCNSYPCPTGWEPIDGASETVCTDNACTTEQCCGEWRGMRQLHMASYLATRAALHLHNIISTAWKFGFCFSS